ncbi:Trafficking protein particle complex subunit 9 [Branchiostoma belcheri]|nr:Trafficking protein particle complex subunit 9 [Branchiostoma belcheri]
MKVEADKTSRWQGNRQPSTSRTTSWRTSDFCKSLTALVCWPAVAMMMMQGLYLTLGPRFGPQLDSSVLGTGQATLGPRLVSGREPFPFGARETLLIPQPGTHHGMLTVSDGVTTGSPRHITARYRVEGRIVSRWCRASSLDPFMPSTDAAHLRCQFMGLQLTAQKRRRTAEEALTDLSSCGPKRGPSVRYSPCIIIMATVGQQATVKTLPPRFYQHRSYRHGFHGAVSDLQKSEVLQDVVLEVESRQIWRRGLDAAMLLSYIYSGTLHVSLDRVQHLYQAADLLQLDYVSDTCSRYMATNIEHSTCVDLYKFADAFAQCLVLKCDPTLPPLLQCMVSISEEF